MRQHRPPHTSRSWSATGDGGDGGDRPRRETITLPVDLQEAFRAGHLVRIERPVEFGERAIHRGGGIQQVYDNERIIVQRDETLRVRCGEDTAWAQVISIGRRYGNWRVMVRRADDPGTPPPPTGVQGTEESEGTNE
jgi:hypothetical protein